MALTKIDVLDELPEIPVCIGYSWCGSVLVRAALRARGPARGRAGLQNRARLAGERRWATKTWEELPPAARDYISILEEEVGAPVGFVSTGPAAEETIVLEIPELDWLLGAAPRRHQGQALTPLSLTPQSCKSIQDGYTPSPSVGSYASW